MVRFAESTAIILAADAGPVERRAAAVLAEEIEKRTGITLETLQVQPRGRHASIILSTEARACGPEGYRLEVSEAVAKVTGADPRGLLYGIGRLLRSMELRRGSIVAPELNLASAPRMRLRGAQLGYRPKPNAYDAWSPEQFDQYIRELALFGANAIEILPPRTDDDLDSPHFKVPPLQMMEHLSTIIDSYGLDVWVWYPNMARDYADPATLAAEEAERDDVFSRLCRVDHVMIPGGDPGDLEPALLFSWSARVAEILHRHHPNARIWISPQVFKPSAAWMEEFHAEVAREPEWLGGLVYAPWVPCTLEELRARTPSRLPIRNYPDVTHSLNCQFPVESWDLAFALTLGRECCNPRPLAEKHIHNLQAPHVIGNLVYSEGINDDINKLIWLDQDWDAERPVVETLRDIGRLFVGPDFAEGVAHGLLALECNWCGPLVANGSVETTLAQWQAMERQGDGAALASYRFKMNLQRAYYDAYTRRRLVHETEIESQARELLEKAAAGLVPAAGALDRAEALLRSCDTERPSIHLRDRCWQLAGELFAEIGWQTSVPRHQAIGWARGAFMDGIDVPLNDRCWLLAELVRVRALGDDEARRAALRAVVERTNPGPGGFYHDLGTEAGRQIVARTSDQTWARDPGAMAAPFADFEPAGLRLFYVDPAQVSGQRAVPLAWIGCVSVNYLTPLRLRYPAVEPSAAYRLHVVYFKCRHHPSVRLLAGGIVVHEALSVRDATMDAGYHPVHEFAIPPEATRSGSLELEWQPQPGTRTFGVSEVRLLREQGTHGSVRL